MSTDPTIEPDTKDWTWVLQRSCPECAVDVSAVPPEEIANRLLANAERWRRVLARADVASRPEPGVWSALEYACHVRDVHRVFATRVRAMQDTDDPLFQNWDQDEAAVLGRYGEQPPGRVADELATSAEDVASAYAGVEGLLGTVLVGAATARPSPLPRLASTTCTTWSTTWSTLLADVRSATMRHTEFWARMEHALGAAYARTWAEQQVISTLGHRTVSEALEAGESPKKVWLAVWERLELPPSQR